MQLCYVSSYNMSDYHTTQSKERIGFSNQHQQWLQDITHKLLKGFVAITTARLTQESQDN